jgi:hypothetical protein
VIRFGTKKRPPEKAEKPTPPPKGTDTGTTTTAPKQTETTPEPADPTSPVYVPPTG